MNLDEQKLQLFENYTSGDMPEEEKKRLEDELNSNPELKELFNEFNQAVMLINEEGLRREISDIHDRNSSKTISIKKVIPYAVAASIAGVMLISYFVWPQKRMPSELFMSYYEPYPNIYQTRSQESTDLASALINYSSGDYEGALNSLNSLKESTDGVHFYRSLCYLSLNQPEEALRSIKNLSKTTVFNEQAQWYTGLAFLHLNSDSALNYLRKVKPDNFEYASAQEIISELE